MVDYSADTMLSYLEVISDIKNEFLEWAYDDDSPVPDEVLDVVKEMNGVDIHTFFGTFKRWKAMFGDISKLPLPVVKRILPAYHAYWNATKSGSDTTTMLMDKCATLYTPVQYLNCNSRMTNRNIMFLFVLLHRLVSIIMANEDLSSYTSLTAFRKANTQRSTFHHTLLLIKDCLKTGKIGEQIVEERIEGEDDVDTQQIVRNTFSV